MRTAPNNRTAPPRSHRPRAVTVFAAAFLAGAAAAVVVNRALDVRLAQSKPRVESETIFVALRSLPQGAPVTVWDVALREWPKAMMPGTALRASDSFSGLVLRHPLREGQPLLSIQLVRAEPGTPRPEGGTPPPAGTIQTTDSDLWSPAQPARTAVATPATTPFVPVAAPVLPAAAVPPAAAPVVAPVVAAPVVAAPIAADVVPQPTPISSAPSEAAVVAAQPPAVPETSTAATVTTITPGSTAAQTDSDVAATSPNDVPASATATPAPANEPVSIEPAPMQPADTTAARQPAVTDSDVADIGSDAATTVEEAAVPAPQPTPTDTAAAEMTPEPANNTAEIAPIPAPMPVPVPTADGVAENPAAAQQPAAVAQSIVVPPATPAPQPVERPSTGQARYLVVPESIAVQADASFTVRPPVEQPVEATSAQRQPQALPTQPSNAVRPLPATETARRNQRPTAPQGGNQQGNQPSRTGRQPAPAENQSGWTMFPNISAGIGAIEGELGRIRRDRAAQAAPPAATRPRPQY